MSPEERLREARIFARWMAGLQMVLGAGIVLCSAVAWWLR